MHTSRETSAPNKRSSTHTKCIRHQRALSPSRDGCMDLYKVYKILLCENLLNFLTHTLFYIWIRWLHFKQHIIGCSRQRLSANSAMSTKCYSSRVLLKGCAKEILCAHKVFKIRGNIGYNLCSYQIKYHTDVFLQDIVIISTYLIS